MGSFDEAGKPTTFQIVFVTADRKRGTGGEFINIPQASVCVGFRAGKVVTDKRYPTTPVASHKNPNHWANSTRNLLLPNGGIRTIHIRLITEFNNQKVYF
jgi:hypothetical protein